MDSRDRVQQLNPTGHVLGHSPATVKPSSVDRSRGYEEGEPNADSKRRNKFLRLVHEMAWSFLSVAGWMSACLPQAEINSADSVFQPFNVTLNKNEAAMYPGLCNGINDILRQIGCTEFLTYCTADLPDNAASASDTPDIMDTYPIKVDLSILPKRLANPRATERKANIPSTQTPSSDQLSSSLSSIPPGAPPRSSDSPHASTYLHGSTTAAPNEDTSPLNAQDGVRRGTPAKHEPPRAECSWHSVELLVEVKLHPKYFPFPEHNALSDGAEHIQSRGQLASYALQVLRMQHRKHVFLISICGKRARLVLFDRSGGIVSESFDYTTEAGATLIGQFLYRLFRPSATPEKREADPTATPASDEDAEFFSSLHERFTEAGSKSQIGKRFKDAAADRTSRWPIYTLNITSPWSQLGSDQEALPVRKDSPIETHRCLVGKPMFTGRSVMGRGTKCFVAWDLNSCHPVMIKDSWRADHESLRPELDTYTTLWEGKTSAEDMYVPTPLGGGDVYHVGDHGRQYQRTLVPAVHVPPSTTEPQREPRIHTRLVLKEICETLEDFTDAEQLVGVILTALIAHSNAWDTHKILHRDISVHNILIYYSDPYDPKCVAIGLLSDWDLARTESQLQQGSLLDWHSGTWQYMSALLQFMREKHYEVSDDLESFMHVLNWCALRYLWNKWSNNPVELADHMDAFFNSHRVRKLQDGTTVPTGMQRKLTMICDGQPFASVQPSDHPFAELLKDLAVLCQQHYATYDIDQIMANSMLQGQDQPEEPQRAMQARVSTYLGIVASKDPMKRAIAQAQDGAYVGPREPTTPTRAGSSRAPGPGSDDTLEYSDPIFLDSPPAPSPQARTVKARSESPLLNHAAFLQAFMKILQRKVVWDLLPRRVNTLKPSNATVFNVGSGSSSGSSTGAKRRSAENVGDYYEGAKRKKKSGEPSPRGFSNSDDPFLDDSAGAASSENRGRTDDHEGEDEVGNFNAATQIFMRGNQSDSTRTSRVPSTRRKSPKNTPSSSRSASPTA